MGRPIEENQDQELERNVLKEINKEYTNTPGLIWSITNTLGLISAGLLDRIYCKIIRIKYDSPFDDLYYID